MGVATTILLVLACTDDSTVTATDSSTADSATPSTDSAEPTDTDPVVAVLTLTADDNPVTAVAVALSLESAAPAAVTCTAAGESADVHRVEALTAATEHTWTLHGLLSSETYRCEASVDGSPAGSGVEVTTGALPADLVEGTVTTSDTLAMTGAYTLYNHKGFCDGEQAHRLVIVDPHGRVRWYWDGLDSDFGVGVVGEYLGDGVVMSAGGTGENAGPRLSDLDGEVLYETPSDWGVVFHHYSEQLSDGHMLSVAEAEDHNDLGESWEGVHLIEHDPETDTIVREWFSQTAVDAGGFRVFDVGRTGDNLNTNWVSRDTAGAWYLSICGAQRIAKLDPGTGEVLWVIGPNQGWDLVDETGAALTVDDWPQCQHGNEVLAEDTLLVYDNGRDRLEARAAEYVVDTDASTVTRSWVWTEPEWYEQAWGDIDQLSDDRVLLGIGHCTCCPTPSDNVSRIQEVDRPSGEVVWRYELPDDDSVLYQASRIDGCAVFHNTRFCPALGE